MKRHKDKILIAIATAVLIAIAVLGLFIDEANSQTESRPNFVFILTDDMRRDDMEYMPKTQSLIFDEGITYSNAITPLAQCCPARSTILTGMYPHNHQVFSNDTAGGPDGGPLGIRGPGISAGRVTNKLASLQDIAPTLAELGVATVTRDVDGRSLVPTFNADPLAWRQYLLEEFYDADGSDVPNHKSVISEDRKYIRLNSNGAEEFYDTVNDPYEMQSNPAMSGKSTYSTKLTELATCSSVTCRVAEDG